MEKDKAKKGSIVDKRTRILSGFQLYILENGQLPPSIFKFAKELKMKEEEFYEHFTSFDALQAAVWVGILEKTLEDLSLQEPYRDYSAREKLLAFFFTWVEQLKKNRSYLLVLYDNASSFSKLPPPEVRDFKKRFKEFATPILLEAKESGEIAHRPIIAEKYDEALWFQLWFIFQFWLKDNSSAFEKTDAAIEKSVNLAFDLMGKSALDTLADFAKFLYQNK